VLSTRFAAQARAPVQLDVMAPSGGFVAAMDTRAIGLIVVALGGGRLRASDAVDPRVGLSSVLAIGTPVQAGTALARVHARNHLDAAAARDRLLAAITLRSKKPLVAPAVLWSSAPG
jgi:thymidine phosphorylase